MSWRERPELEARVVASLREYPVTLLLGPRQCGKTSLARRIAARRGAVVYDLEDPGTPLRPETARTILGEERGLVVIDEVQRQPGLFPLLRVLADRRPRPARFLLLGSASPEIVRGVSESLAGRAAFVEMGGFTLAEAGPRRWRRLWTRGGLPPSFLAPSAAASHRWRMNLVQSFLERDIPQLGIRVPAAALRRFWTMLAHLHGQVWNAAELGRAMGVKEDTARHYRDILTGAFMVRQVQPWFENIGKRVVKSPKVYFRDTGLLHALLGLGTETQVLSHPRLGFSWEGFALEEAIRSTAAEREAYFYRTHAGAEIDLVIARGGRRYGFEFKFADAPAVTKSMRIALADLGLHRLWVVHPGDRAFRLAPRIEAVPLARLAREVGRL